MKEAKQIILSQREIKSPTIADILTYSWEDFTRTHETREVEKQEVAKALSCRSDKVFIYECTKCHETLYQLLGCNSRICSRCGKRYNDQWATSLSKAMFQVPHRHFVLSVPSKLWPNLKENRTLWKPYMDAAIETCNDYFPKIMHNPNIKPGAIVILHPFGKDMKFQPHLHVIVTEGGFDGRGNFIKKEFFPARPFARCWQYHVSTNLQKAGVPASLFAELYAEYDGFYVWVHKSGKIKNPKDIAKYLGRYVRHPAIANNRLTRFNGRVVEFYYEEQKEDAVIRHDISMPVDEFIAALIQHIPDKQFKMVRYYGTYARKCKKVFSIYASQSSIASLVQDTLYMPGRKFKPICPFCRGMLVLWSYQTIPPPGDYFHWEPNGKKMVDWIIRN